MRFLLQRVAHASVTVDSKITGRIDSGLLVLVGLGAGDSDKMLRPMLEKTMNLRIFNDDAGQLNRSLIDVGGGLLLVSQFTLYADAKKGRRPSYIAAMPPAEATALFDRLVLTAKELFNGPVESGVFGAHMKVDLQNDGPVTIWLDSDELGIKG